MPGKFLLNGAAKRKKQSSKAEKKWTLWSISFLSVAFQRNYEIFIRTQFLPLPSATLSRARINYCPRILMTNGFVIYFHYEATVLFFCSFHMTLYRHFHLVRSEIETNRFGVPLLHSNINEPRLGTG